MVPTFIYVQIANIEIEERIKKAALYNLSKEQRPSRTPIFTRAIKLLKLRAPGVSA